MAQLNITLNQEEIQELLANNSGEAFKKLLQEYSGPQVKTTLTQTKVNARS